jgi:circadian clock protein KaiC
VLEQACKNNERALFVSFDESEEQIIRNLASVNIHLQPHVDAGRLKMLGMRAASSSAHHHVLKIRHMVEAFKPNLLVIDPVTALVKAGGQEVANVLAELLVDFVKSHGITTVFTALVDSSDALAEMTSTHISTMADTWLHLTFAINGGERNRALTIVKSRGSAHSNQVRELILSADGIRLTDVYSGGGQVLRGTARIEAEGRLQLAQDRERFEKHQRERLSKAKVDTLKAQMAAIEAELLASEANVVFEDQFEKVKDVVQGRALQDVLASRSADSVN